MANIMNAKDAVAASLAECYVTIDGNRYNFMQAINLEASIEKTKTEVPNIGKKPEKEIKARRLERKPESATFQLTTTSNF